MEPRKNLETVVEAYSSMKDELKNTHPLVIAGPTGWKSAGVRRLANRAQRVILTGYVRRSLLPALYHSATLFVFPSLYEGFGMPLTEAMAARLPIVRYRRINPRTPHACCYSTCRKRTRICLRSYGSHGEKLERTSGWRTRCHCNCVT